jgi:tetratricopeptide (TPR) repeat protein
LAAAGEADDARRRHAEYFTSLAETAEAAAFDSTDNEWLDMLEEDHDNLRAVLAWSAAEPERLPEFERLVSAMWRLWQYHGHIPEGARWCHELAQQLTASSEAVAPTVAYAIAATLFQASELEEAVRWNELALSGFRANGDDLHAAWCLNDLGIIASWRGELQQSIDLLNECLSLKRRAGHRWDIAVSLDNLAEAQFLAGDLAGAEATLVESLSILDGLGHDGLGVRGDVLLNLGVVRLRQGDAARAAIDLHAGLEDTAEATIRPQVAKAITCLAAAALVDGRPVRAVRLFAAGTAMQGALGSMFGAIGSWIVERYGQEARQALTPAAYDLAWNEGLAMSLDDAVAYARES